MRSSNKLIAYMLLCLMLISAALPLIGCGGNSENNGNKKDNDFGLTQAQSANILAIAEAFAESGHSYNSENPLSVADMEYFVYYLYNDELKSSDSAYAVVSEEEALERIRMYFGITSVLHPRKNADDPDYYYNSGNYYVKASETAYQSIKIVSFEEDESGNSNASIEGVGKDGTRVVLDFIFNIDGDNVKVLSCTRYDEK